MTTIKEQQDLRNFKKTLGRAATYAGLEIPKGFNAKVKTCGDPCHALTAMANDFFGFPEKGDTATYLLLQEMRKYNADMAERADCGLEALAYLGEHIGPQETWGKNQGPLLQEWAIKLSMLWMHLTKQPWCGEAVQAAFMFGAGIDLKAEWPNTSFVYTPSIAAWIRSGAVSKSGLYRVDPIPFERSAPGDIVVFDWQRAGAGGPNMAADHVALVRRRPTMFMLPTREGNTPRGASGDQSGLGSGDGIWDRERSQGEVLVIGRVTPTSKKRKAA